MNIIYPVLVIPSNYIGLLFMMFISQLLVVNNVMFLDFEKKNFIIF